MIPTKDPKRTVKAFYIEEYPEEGYAEPGAVYRKSGNVDFSDHLVFACPGCGQWGSIRAEHPKPCGSPSWDIASGSLADVTTLTLSPSVLCSGCCQWHGHLTAGVFQSC